MIRWLKRLVDRLPWNRKRRMAEFRARHMQVAEELFPDYSQLRDYIDGLR